jgi:ATP-dependent Clp protease protease subunit
LGDDLMSVTLQEILDSAFSQLQKTPPLDEYIAWKDWQNRILIINEPIDENSVYNFILPILRWNKEDDENDVRKTITIYLNTPGGDVGVGLILAEVIKKSKTPVHVITVGEAASMGSIILMSGHKRIAYSFASILIHDGEVGMRGSRNKVKDNMKFYEEKYDQLKTFIIDHTKITEEKLEEMKDREWWITAEQALELGIIDEII